MLLKIWTHMHKTENISQGAIDNDCQTRLESILADSSISGGIKRHLIMKGAMDVQRNGEVLQCPE